MVFKSLIAAAAVAGIALTAASTAEAKKPQIDVHVDLGGYYGDEYQDVGYGGWEEEGYGQGHHGGWRISCVKGKQKVRWAGFNKVIPIDCEGRTYAYKARKHGDWYVVTVGARRGRIIDVSPAY